MTASRKSGIASGAFWDKLIPFGGDSDPAESAIAQKIIGSVIRHGLTLLGGYLVTSGWIDGSDWEKTAAGLATTLAALVWSLWQKRQQEKVIKTALSMPKGTTREHLEDVAPRDKP